MIVMIGLTFNPTGEGWQQWQYWRYSHPALRSEWLVRVGDIAILAPGRTITRKSGRPISPKLRQHECEVARSTMSDIVSAFG